MLTNTSAPHSLASAARLRSPTATSVSRVARTVAPARSRRRRVRRAMSSVHVFSSLPDRPIAPLSVPPWPGSSMTFMESAGGRALRTEKSGLMTVSASAWDTSHRRRCFRTGLCSQTRTPLNMASRLSAFSASRMFSPVSAIPAPPSATVSLSRCREASADKGTSGAAAAHPAASQTAPSARASARRTTGR